MKYFILTILIGLTVLSGAEAGEKDRGQKVAYRVAGGSYEGYMINMSAQGKLVVIVHDWDGLTDYEIRRAEMLAELGYSVFCIDMFGSGVRPTDTAEKRKLTGALYADREKMRVLLNGGLQAAKHHGGNTDNAVIMGYCFGGTCVLELARAGVTLKGFVGFHAGLAIPEGQDYKQTRGEVLIFHGTADKHVPMEHFSELGKALEAAQVRHEMITYGGAPHAFSVFGSDRYRKEADTKSWSRFTNFLKRILLRD